jgi:hypothetical protein
MPQKNDLSAIKAVNKKTLLQTESAIPKNENRAGRKFKSIDEKESETVVLKLTLKELENLKEKAGLVPLGTFIKHHLRNKTDLLG